MGLFLIVVIREIIVEELDLRVIEVWQGPGLRD